MVVYYYSIIRPWEINSDGILETNECKLVVQRLLFNIASRYNIEGRHSFVIFDNYQSSMDGMDLVLHV